MWNSQLPAAMASSLERPWRNALSSVEVRSLMAWVDHQRSHGLRNELCARSKRIKKTKSNLQKGKSERRSEAHGK
jgi:hypothetical protein